MSRSHRRYFEHDDPVVRNYLERVLALDGAAWATLTYSVDVRSPLFLRWLFRINDWFQWTIAKRLQGSPDARSLEKYRNVLRELERAKRPHSACARIAHGLNALRMRRSEQSPPGRTYELTMEAVVPFASLLEATSP